MIIRYCMLFISLLVLASACSTSGADNKQVYVTPEARRTAEAAQQAAESATQAGESSAAANAAPLKNDPNEVVCRDEPPPAGSRLGKRRICATRGEWDALAESAREETLRIQDGAKYCVPTPTRPC